MKRLVDQKFLDLQAENAKLRGASEFKCWSCGEGYVRASALEELDLLRGKLSLAIETLKIYSEKFKAPHKTYGNYAIFNIRGLESFRCLSYKMARKALKKLIKK